jgi:hypothetical protein
MDELRALAYLDILLDRDSRPAVQDDTASCDGDGDGEGTADGPGGPDGPSWPEPAVPGARNGGSGGSGGSVIPAGFAGKINLTVPATTLLDLADRPGEITGIGPADPRSRSKYIGSLPDRASIAGPDSDANMLLCAPLLTCLPL